MLPPLPVPTSAAVALWRTPAIIQGAEPLPLGRSGPEHPWRLTDSAARLQLLAAANHSAVPIVERQAACRAPVRRHWGYVLLPRESSAQERSADFEG